MVMIAAAIVVVLIPVSGRMPAMTVFVTPSVCVRPAVRTLLVQFLASFYRLSACPAVVFGGFVQSMVGFCDALLACLFMFIGANDWCAGENESRQCRSRHRCPSPERLLSLILHFYSALLTID